MSSANARWLLQLLLFLFVICYVIGFEEVSMISSGSFQMGSDKGQFDEAPKHLVRLSDFYVDRYEVSIKNWVIITDFASKNRYQFSESQQFPKRGPGWYSGADRLDFPMNMITWFDAIKWCNARSEYMGRLPLYYDFYTNETIRDQNLDSSSEIAVYWNRSGYRLPTEAEWEKAARGNAAGYKFPWGNSIDGNMANYKLSGDPFDDGSTPVGYFSGKQDISVKDYSFGGEKRNPIDNKNIYGLYDVVGNVSEWCWDWYDDKWYQNQKNSNRDDRGPAREDLTFIDPAKVHRGGGFKNDNTSESGESLRIAFRHVSYPHEYSTGIGLRTVRGNFHDPLWADSKTTEFDDWMYSSWLGYYFQAKNLWSFFPSIGWVYPYGHGSYDNWLYFHSIQSWMWTSKSIHPWHFEPTLKIWYKLDINEGLSSRFLSQDLTREILILDAK